MAIHSPKNDAERYLSNTLTRKGSVLAVHRTSGTKKRKMGLTPESKRDTVTRWPASFHHNLTSMELKRYSVMVTDIMGMVKSKPEGIQTAEQYKDYMVRRVRMAMERRVPYITKVFVVCVDAGSPTIKKLIAHVKRHRGVEPLDPGNQLILPARGPLPLALWPEIMANRDIMHREIYPMLWEAIREKVQLPHMGQFVILQGCPSIYPVHPENRHMLQWGQVLYKEHATLVDNRSGQLVSAGIQTGVSAALQNSIKEADDAVVFYVLHHARQRFNVHVYMNDTDVIPLMLLNTPERIDPNLNQFMNEVMVQLPGKPTKSKKLKRERSKESHPWLREGGDLFVDINHLYESITNDSLLVAAGVANPVLSVCALMIMDGNDYFTHYGPNKEYRLFYGFSHRKFVVETFHRYAHRFSHMFQLSYGGNMTLGDHTTMREPYIDEYAFYEFCLQCYAARHAEHIIEEDGQRLTLKQLEEHCAKPLKRLKPRRAAETPAQFAKRKSRMKRRKGESVEQFRARVDAAQPKEAETEKAYRKRLNAAKWKRLPPKHLFRYWARMLEYALLRIYNAHRHNSERILDPFRLGEDGRPYFPYRPSPEDPERATFYAGPLSKPRKAPFPYRKYVRKRVAGDI